MKLARRGTRSADDGDQGDEAEAGQRVPDQASLIKDLVLESEYLG